MTDINSVAPLWTARLLGACAGAAVSLVYLLPKSRREAAARFVTGVVIGLVFGGPTGLFLAARLQLTAGLSPFEIMLGGATAASLSAWWALGLIARIAERYGEKPRG